MAEFEAAQFRPDMEDILGGNLFTLVSALSTDPTAFVPALQHMLHGKVIEYEEKAKEEALEKIEKEKSKIEKKLPTKEGMIEKFKSSACSPAAQKAMERLYFSIRDKLEGAKGKVEPIRDKLYEIIEKGETIKALIRTIGENLLLLSTVVAIIAAVIVVLKALIIVLKGAAAFPLLSPIIPAIIEIEKVVIKISDKIVDPMVSMLVDAIPETLAIIGMMVVAIAAAIAAAIAIIEGFLAFIDTLIRMLEALYTKYLTTCNVVPTDTDGDGLYGDGVFGSNQFDYDNYLNGNVQDYLNDTLDNLNAQGNTEVIEKFYNANFTQLEYKRYKV